MVKIKWSRNAIGDLKEICRFIASDSSFYARIFKDRVFEVVEHLRIYPELGRTVPESEDSEVRELIYKGYRIIYQEKEDWLEIIAVIHGSRLLKL